ncbi:hypothetical protein EVAR_75458_1 [Eumeta japonica]|uniref:Uncharacterized protein n=1 Tax=Eumeta variegata TaxID=151549 RepID=A0A4C1TMZ4_EUMVA|nr:hypothetical protein EVAR_75458_1 [Eumeta japonica]
MTVHHAINILKAQPPLGVREEPAADFLYPQASPGSDRALARTAPYLFIYLAERIIYDPMWVNVEIAKATPRLLLIFGEENVFAFRAALA